jgi:hypothetical protein
MLGGNMYTASVVKPTFDMMTVIIRETFQDPRQAGKLSFPPKGMEEVRPYGDRLLSTDSELEDDSEDESGYTIIGGDEVEVLPEESSGDDDSGNDDD